MLKLLNDGPNSRKPWVWTPNNEARAEDIKTIIFKYRSKWPLTERFVHYRLISSELLEGSHWRKNGNPKHELVDVYPALGRVLKWMRFHDRVPRDSIGDEHRLVTPKIGFEDVHHFISQELRNFLTGYRKCVAAKQEYYTEVWIEKGTLMHIAKEVADEFCRRTVVCKGYNSVAFQMDYYERATAALMRDQVPVVLYFGDWDPSGCDMPYAILKTFQEMGLVKVDFYRCGLNPEHFSELQAKPVPLNMRDPRTKNFLKQPYTAAYELDAFEPDELQQLVRESLEAFTDMDILEGDQEQEDEDYDYLDDLSNDVQKFMQDRLSL